MSPMGLLCVTPTILGILHARVFGESGPMSPVVSHDVIPIIILNWNGFEDTQQCVEHALAQTGVSYRIWVIDNGSDGDDFANLQALFGSHPLVTVTRNESNLGFTGGMNAAMESILSDPDDCPEYLALLNNDAFVSNIWLYELHQKALDGAGAVASSMRCFSDPNLMDNAGHVWLNTGEVLPRGARELADRFDQESEVEGVCGGACLISTAMLKDIGLFDDFFDTGYEDAEFGLRALLSGHRMIYAPKARVSHKIGASIDKIRDLGYAVRLQVNINYTYLKLTPWPVLVMNAPWVITKTMILLTAPILFFRWRLWKVHVMAGLQTLALLPTIYQKRAQVKRPVLGLHQILGRQQSFIGYYKNYFRKYILSGEKTVFER